MPELLTGKATICIINYKTLDLVRLALRSIRKFTHFPYEVIVIDNDSQDESTQYLRSLKWIRLIERSTEHDLPGSGGSSHSAGLDMGLKNCDTEFFISMHSDTLVKKDNWLTELIGYFDNNPEIACVGSDKIEATPKWRQFLKKATDIRTFKRKLLRTPDPIGKYRYYNRTFCCLYRTDLLKRHNLSFAAESQNGLTSGKKLYFELVDHRYKTIELPVSVMSDYVVHLAHATQVINIAEFNIRSKTIRKCNWIMRKIIGSDIFQQIMADDSLDE